jgi:hypothetical protein
MTRMTLVTTVVTTVVTRMTLGDNEDDVGRQRG